MDDVSEQHRKMPHSRGVSMGDKTGIPSRALQGRTNQNNVIQNQAWKSKVNDVGWEVRTGCKNTWAVVIIRGMEQGARSKRLTGRSCVLHAVVEVHGYISGIKIALTLGRARADMDDVVTD